MDQIYYQQQKRQEILEYIDTSPGISIEELSNGMNINRETLRHHLRLLRENNYISIEKEGHSNRIFPNRGIYSGREREIISLCHNNTQAKILALIMKYPGIKNVDLKKELNVSKSTVTWHINKIEGAGILSKRICGKCKYYYIKSGLEPVIIENLPDEIREKYDFFHR